MNGIHPTSCSYAPFPVLDEEKVVARLYQAKTGDYLFYRPHDIGPITLAWKMHRGLVKIKIEHNGNRFSFVKNEYLKHSTYATPGAIIKANKNWLSRPLVIAAIEQPYHFQSGLTLEMVAERMRGALPRCYLFTDGPHEYLLFYRDWFGIGQATFTVNHSGLITLMEKDQLLHFDTLEALREHFNVKQSLLDVERQRLSYFSRSSTLLDHACQENRN